MANRQSHFNLCILPVTHLVVCVLCNCLPQEKKPQYLIAVPRLYESLHKSILSSFQAQSKLKRSIVSAATAVSAGYTHARDVAKGLVVANKQPSVVAKVKDSSLSIFFFCSKQDADRTKDNFAFMVCTILLNIPSLLFLSPVISPPANGAALAAVEARWRSRVVRSQVNTQHRTCSFLDLKIQTLS